MDTKSKGRGCSPSSVYSRLIDWMRQQGAVSGRQLRQWSRDHGIDVDAMSQARFRAVRSGKIRRRDDVDVVRWEVVE